MTHIPQGPASCPLANPDISPSSAKYLVRSLGREDTSESPEPAASMPGTYKRAAREIMVVAASAVGGLTFFAALRIGVVFFPSLHLFSSDCMYHVEEQTTLFILPSHVFQIGSPSRFVESLICRGASPSAPVDSSTAACSVPRSRLSSRRAWVRSARHWERLGDMFFKHLSFPPQCELIACQPWTAWRHVGFVHLGPSELTAVATS